MHHGLSDEQVRELSRCWAMYDFHEKTYRFLTGCWSTLDFSIAIDGIEQMWGYAPEFVDDSVRQSVLTSAVDAVPLVTDPASANTVLRLVASDQNLLKRLIRLISSGRENKELDPEFYMEVLDMYCRLSKKPKPAVSLPGPRAYHYHYQFQVDAFRAATASFIDREDTTDGGNRDSDRIKPPRDL